MSISPETLNALQNLIREDADLLAQLQNTPSPHAAAALIARAGAAAGITVDEASLAARLETEVRALDGQTLSDEDLDRVAGGVDWDKIRLAALSISTLGIGCLVDRAFHAVQQKNH